MNRPGAAISLSLLVFVVGLVTLGTEITAARLLAPFFGASTIVWANTIAVVLVALSIGYWLGGRLADRYPNIRALCFLILIAAVLLAFVPIIARPFLSMSVAAFDDLSVGAFAGSLFGVLVLVAIPVLMLGAVSPWVIRLKLETVENSGQVAGRMYAIGTFGSLAGTFVAALLLIPMVGTQRTFLVFAALLGITAVIGIGWRWVALPVGLVAMLAVPVGTVKAVDGAKVVHEADTEYQYARVLEFADGRRQLELNEGQAVHSTYSPRTVLTGNYWDSFLTAPTLKLGKPPRKIAILGNGAGTMVRAYERFFPQTKIDAVEIDGELTKIGKRYFGLSERPGVNLVIADARSFLRRTKARYDAIIIDSYRQPYVPFHLSTEEFFQLVQSRLTPKGAVFINIGHPERSDDLEKMFSTTLASVFKNVRRAPMQAVNSLVIAAGSDISRPTLTRNVARLPAPLRPIGTKIAARTTTRLPGGEVYTDDRAPVEWLIDRSIIRYTSS